jgi:ribosomal protein L21
MLNDWGRGGGETSDRGDKRPVPDPTALTTEQLNREILHLRELMESRLDQMDRRAAQVVDEQRVALEAALRSSDKAVVAALAASSKAIVELDANTTRRIDGVKEVTDNKFVTYETLLVSQSEKVALAREAADKAVAKAEVFNEKRFDILTKQIEELKAKDAHGTGKSQGLNAGWGILVGAFGLVATFLTIVVIIMNIATT